MRTQKLTEFRIGRSKRGIHLYNALQLALRLIVAVFFDCEIRFSHLVRNLNLVLRIDAAGRSGCTARVRRSQVTESAKPAGLFRAQPRPSAGCSASRLPAKVVERVSQGTRNRR